MRAQCRMLRQANAISLELPATCHTLRASHQTLINIPPCTTERPWMQPGACPSRSWYCDNDKVNASPVMQ